MYALEQSRFDAILCLVALEQVAQVVVSDLSDEAGLHPEYCGACDCVRCRSSRHELYAHRLEGLPYLVSGLHIHMLHTASREVVLLEERVVRKDSQYVGQCVTDA